MFEFSAWFDPVFLLCSATGPSVRPQLDSVERQPDRVALQRHAELEASGDGRRGDGMDIAGVRRPVPPGRRRALGTGGRTRRLRESGETRLTTISQICLSQS